MSDILTDKDFALLRDYIEKNCGIHLEPEKAYLIESRLIALMAENGCDTMGQFYLKASADRTMALRDKIVDAMTTNETLWFRDAGPYEILRDLLDQLWKEVRDGKRSVIRIWSAACSTGQEPYSMAIAVREFARSTPGFRLECVEILATDISPTVLFMAQAGRYDSIAISRGLSDTLRDRYFTPSGRVWAVSDEIKKMVTLKKLNLQDQFSIVGQRDIVFCRNVMIYFSESFKRDVLAKLARPLRPNGYLMVGSSESVASYCDEYRMIRHPKGLYYQVKEAAKQ